MTDWSRYDESDAKVRPGRGSRPRSKTRPAHEDALPGTVIAVDRGRYTVKMDGGGKVDGAVVMAVKAREVGRRGLVIGDSVAVVGDTSGTADTLARVVRREERRNTLRRTADDDDPTERVIVANVDQLAIVTALADPEPSPRMIDRFLIAAFDAGMTPILLLTKADLASADDLRASYEPLGVKVIETSVRRDGGPEADAGYVDFREGLRGLTTVLVGSSGVGKSTLVNALVPTAMRAVGVVNDVTGTRAPHVVVGDSIRGADGRPHHRHSWYPQLWARARERRELHQRVSRCCRSGRGAVPARLLPRVRGARLRARRVGRGLPRSPGSSRLDSPPARRPRRKRQLLTSDPAATRTS